MDEINSEPIKKHNKLKWTLIIAGVILLLLFIFRFQLNSLYCSTLPNKPSFFSTGAEQGECYLDLNIKMNKITCIPNYAGCLPIEGYQPQPTTGPKYQNLYNYQYKSSEECASSFSDEFERKNCIEDVQLSKIMNSGNLEDCNLLNWTKQNCIYYFAAKNKDSSLCNQFTSNPKIDCLTQVAFAKRSYLLCYKIDASDWRHECIREVNIARCVIDKSFCLI